MSGQRVIELWCDSFHEGEWLADGILSALPSAKVERSYQLNFIPTYSVTLGDGLLTLVVLGGYGNWAALPSSIRSLLDWGKPDIVGYDPASDKILFAIEETAAVPTGNQTLQRCERMHGSGSMRIPFWYLLSEYGTHIDEGTRQASPWPALMALALTATFNVPNIVLFYSSEDSPEDYAAGAGVDQLFRSIGKLVVNFSQGHALLKGLEPELTSQFASMLSFIDRTYKNVTDFLPSSETLTDPDYAAFLASISCEIRNSATEVAVLDWPSFSKLPATVKQTQIKGGFVKQDGFLSLIESGKENSCVYTLSTNAGSRPQPESDLEDWITQQKTLHSRAETLTPALTFSLNIDDFPRSDSGLRHVTTAKNVLYLIDSATFVCASLENAFPRLRGKLSDVSAIPAMLYVSNSISPGRIFGDPFTGQFAAFSWIFGGSAEKRRLRFAYFPHQSHGILRLNRSGNNKGQNIFLTLADYLIFHAGGVFDTRKRQWL